jgi:hypothetical protein
VLPASSTDRFAPDSAVARRPAIAWPVIIAAILMVYALGAGWGLIGGLIPAERAYPLMALPCLAPMAWCFTGAWRRRNDNTETGEQETGLWISGAGWLLLAFGLMVKYLAVVRAQPDAYAAQASSPLVPLSIALGVLGLLIGAAMCWQDWQNKEKGKR